MGKFNSNSGYFERRRLAAGGVGGLGKGSNPLDSFFPFDPYLLRRSYDFVEPHYRDWCGSCTVDDLEDVKEEVHENENSMNGDITMIFLLLLTLLLVLTV